MSLSSQSSPSPSLVASSDSPSRVRRRGFIARLGLGAGAAVLTPMLTTLHNEARGAVALRKRFIVVTYSNGGFWDWAVPTEFNKDKKLLHTPVSSTEYTMPDMYQPLEPWRSRLLLVDGLANRGADGHFAWNLLTGLPMASGEKQQGRSIDEHVAAGPVGKGTLFPIVHLGTSTGGDGRAGMTSKLSPHMSVKPNGEQVPIQLQPADAFKQLFPSGAPSGGAQGPRGDLVQRRRLLDWLNDDIKRARGSLAGTEKAKLDQYLASVEEAQRRTAAFENLGAQMGGACGVAAPALDPAVKPEADDIFEAQLRLGTSAITCGLTNVLTVAFIGLGGAYRKRLGITYSIHDIGHGQGSGEKLALKYMVWYAQEVGRLIRALQAVREGDRTIFDQTTILFANDNNESHHSRGWRWPVALLGNAGGALKADGRFIRNPPLQGQTAAPGGPSGLRSIADLNATLARVFDHPADDWGKGGLEAVKGPINELL
jgi:hypothetical protein